MKKILLSWLLVQSCLFVVAQTKTLVRDREQLFTEAEVVRLDSMLQQYLGRTGNLLLIATDSLDVSTNTFSNAFFLEHGIDSSSKKAALALLLSRKNGLVFMAANKYLQPYITQDQMIEMLNEGLTSLKEKRREEAAWLICKKAMEFLDTRLK